MIGFSMMVILFVNHASAGVISFQPGGSFAHISNFLAQFDASTAPLMPWPETSDSTQTCPPASDPSKTVVVSRIPIEFPNVPGCYEFKTPNYDTSGYPSAEGSAYVCNWVNKLPPGTRANGRVDGTTFDFQIPNPASGECVDYLAMRNLVNDTPGDDEDKDSDGESTEFCGSLASDKPFTVEVRTFFIKLRVNRARGGRGARIIICF